MADRRQTFGVCLDTSSWHSDVFLCSSLPGHHQADRRQRATRSLRLHTLARCVLFFAETAYLRDARVLIDGEPDSSSRTRSQESTAPPVTLTLTRPTSRPVRHLDSASDYYYNVARGLSILTADPRRRARSASRLCDACLTVIQPHRPRRLEPPDGALDLLLFLRVFEYDANAQHGCPLCMCCRRSSARRGRRSAFLVLGASLELWRAIRDSPCSGRRTAPYRHATLLELASATLRRLKGNWGTTLLPRVATRRRDAENPRIPHAPRTFTVQPLLPRLRATLYVVLRARSEPAAAKTGESLDLHPREEG